jgi:RND superfamily putative drug exporter
VPGEGSRPGHRIASLPCGRRTKWLVLVFWLVVVVATGSLAGKLPGAEKNDASAYLPATAEPTQVHGQVTAPATSKDGRAIETIVGADLGDQANTGGFVQNLKNTASRGDPGLTAFNAGPAASAADQIKVFTGVDSTLLFATLAVVIILLLTYRSPVLWLLPIMASGVALLVAEAVIYLLTQHANLTVNGQSGGILVVLVLGAGTDYALLLVARYREELRRHQDRHEAMAVALHRAGPAILASAGTVIAGMACLLAADPADISGLGPVAAIGIGVGLLAMITLLPALLVISGGWIFWPRRPGFGSPEPASGGLWGRVGRAIARRPHGVWAVTGWATALPNRWDPALSRPGSQLAASSRGGQLAVVAGQLSHRAGRFSRNAAMPSRASSVWDVAAITSTASR